MLGIFIRPFCDQFKRPELYRHHVVDLAVVPAGFPLITGEAGLVDLTRDRQRRQDSRLVPAVGAQEVHLEKIDDLPGEG
jgi:hypothetical protein